MEHNNESKKRALAAGQNIKERDYWLEKLSGELSKTTFPYDSRKTDIEAGSAHIQFKLSPAIHANLMKISNKSDVRLHILLTAGFLTLLHRYTGSSDIIIGTPTYKQDVDGQLINTVLALRSNITGDMAFKELLMQVGKNMVEADKNQNYPIDTLVYKLDIPESTDSFALFDLSVLLENIHDKTYLKPVKQNMIISFNNAPDKMTCDIEYNPRLYRETTIQRILDHYNHLMENALSNVNSKISEIPIMSESEREQVFVTFNDNAAPFHNDKSIYHLVEEFAEKTPNAVAIACEGTERTYSELNARANRIARHLINAGIGPDKTVGILMRRGLQMAESILAVWKAGGAYIPLDVEYPAQRLMGILEDSETTVVLAMSETLDQGFKDQYTTTGNTIIDPDQAADPTDRDPADSRNPVVETSMNDLAYVIYTSGSTGKPKGAMVEHIGMMNHMQSKINVLSVNEKSIVAQNASHTFDISVWQFFVAFTRGGKTIIYPNDLILDPFRFIPRILEDKLTILEVVPSYLSVVLDTLDSIGGAGFPMEYLLVTGEEAKPHLVTRWFEKYPDIPVVNAYGPTEASDDITHHIMTGPPDTERVPIGKPVQNFNIYIADQYGQICPIGVPGELWVAGVGVGRGYLKDPERTAQAFINDPFAQQKDIRLYKTGDLARWLPDGSIDFLGRLDYQVKIRGFRIELGEIENALVSHPLLKEAVVIDREDEENKKYLCAYIVGTGDQRTPDTSALKDFLLKSLPDYMVPAYFVEMNEIPLTPNGKIDRKALPKPETRTGPGLPFISEEMMNQLINQIPGTQKTLPVAKPIQNNVKTAGDLAAEINDEYEKLAEYEAREKTGKTYFPLSHSQKLYYYNEKTYGKTPNNNVCFKIKYLDILDPDLLNQATNIILEKNDALRTRFVELKIGNLIKPAQYFASHQTYENDYLDFSNDGEQRAEDIDTYLDDIVNEPFQLIDSPLYYFSYIKFNQKESGYFLKIHHMICDGASVELIVNEIHQLYHQLKNKETIGTEANPSFIQYLSHEKNYLNSPRLEKHREFWMKTMLPLPNEVDFSTSKGDPLNIAIKMVKYNLPDSLRTQIHQYINHNKTSIFKLIMSVMAIYGTRISHGEDMMIGTVNHGRSTPLLQKMVGMGIKFFPIRVKVPRDLPFEELVRVNGENVNTIVKEYIDYPYEVLLSEIKEKTGVDPRYIDNVNMVGHPTRGEGFDIQYLPPSVSPIPLCVHININNLEKSGILELQWQYQEERFKEEDIAVIHRGIVTLLANALERPETPASELDLLSPEDRTLILETFNGNAMDFPADKTLHQIFVRQAERTPDALAVSVENQTESLTYRQLNEKTDQLAHKLRHRGVKEDSVVAILARRSLELVTGILAVLKAGGAYMTLGLGYPENRIQYMFDDSNTRLMLTDNTRELQEINIDTIDLTDENLYQGDSGLLQPAAGPGNAATVFYTSGSTGTPKGVILEHKGLVNYFSVWPDFFPMEPSDVIMQKTPVIFDFSLWELFQWFFVGASLYFLDPAKSDDPGDLVEAVVKGNVSFLIVAPAYQLAFLDYIEKNKKEKDVAGLKLVLAGGEELLPVHVGTFNRVLYKTNGTRLCNVYGPTECTIAVTWLLCPVDEGVQKITIGKPVKNNRLYIVDDQFKIVPIGVPGQVCITGVGLGRGYFIPELTKEAFIDNPFEPGERFYLTGDLAKWLPNGEIEFLTRIDNQVQVGGIRVELGEIESLLLKHDKIHEAVVVQWTDEKEQILCAFLESAELLPEMEIREILVKELPHFMVPDKFVHLDAMPMTASGKIDRLKLKELVPHVRTGRKNTLVQIKEQMEMSREKRAMGLSAVDKETAWDTSAQSGNVKLTPEEKQQVLFTFNDTKADYPNLQTISRLFVEQARRTPDRTAVTGTAGTPFIAAIDETVSLTYRELDEKSNQLARVLRERGVDTDSIVGILTERTIEMIIAMMAVLKAGGAYMALSLTYPDNRIEFMSLDSNIPLLITDNKRPVSARLSGMTLDIASEDFFRGDSRELPDHNQPRGLATVFYTSGSTGTPKGVLVEHEGLVNRINWMQRRYPIGETDVILQKTAVVFDVSLWELFWWSFYGASAYLMPPGKGGHPQDTVDAIKDGRVTTMHFTPTAMIPFLHHLDNQNNTGDVATLKQVFASGEALPPSLVNHFNRLLFNNNHTRLYNLYGPTEASVDVSYYDCPTEPGQEKIPIGKPIDNIRLYIVNPNMEPLPVGVAGQLCIAGIGLARGYLNRPLLTAEAFRDNPFEPGDRMYLTGDLARWLPDGNIEFLGRIDHQVQINGIRIELGEIESLLLKHADIKEAVVVSRLDDDDEPFLCAFVVSAINLAQSDFRESLSRELPHYMMPAMIVQLEKMPTTTTGKANRKVLEAIDIKMETDVEFVAPETEMETKVANVWKEVLNLEQVGVNDNFFDIGGNSLGIIQVNVRLKEVFQQDIPALIMFEYPTIKSMVQYLEKNLAETTAPQEPEEKDRTEIKAKGRSKMQDRRKKMKKGRNT